MTTLHEINQKARSALVEALGPVDHTRYQQQFSSGRGDYTAERRESDTAAIIQRVAEAKAAGLLPAPTGAEVRETGAEGFGDR